jgi:hypothetical protein
MALPTVKSKVSCNWNDQKFLMIGSSGIGKSTFWSFGKNVLYIETEAGLNFIEAYKQPCRTWGQLGETLKDLLQAAKTPETFPYDAVVVDTIDRVVDLASEAALEWGRAKFTKSDIKTIGDIGQGTGWDIRRQNVDKVLKAIEVLPCAKVIIGHLESKKIEEDGAKGYDKSTISIGGKVGGDILAWSDHTLHVKGVMMGDQLKRTVYTKPTKSREAKSRGGIIKDGWTWSDNDEDNFNKLREQFD